MALTLESLKPIYPKYPYKYTDRPKDACATCLSDKNPYNLLPDNSNKYKYEVKSEPVEQLSGRITDCRGKSRGLFFQNQPSGNLDTFYTNKSSDDCKTRVPVICPGRTRTRCTQTRYRECSAQTRPEKPEVDGDKENYKDFEVYQVSKLLEGFYPPGEYETKVVERARRRRNYEKALQLVVNDREKHLAILEAIEWEDWIAREEDIQGCQMLRMQIVTRMFEERKNNLQTKSEKRMEYSTEKIQAKRAAQLKKITIEYSRGRRRLEAKRQKINHSYHKGNITQDHIDPASDLYAPKMRFGVNPNRRHYVGFRKNFDDRINDLDKRKNEKGLASLICPFSKLRNWAKPKEQMKEVTQRFLSDENLENLFENLRSLRMIAETPKPYPNCLKKRIRHAAEFHRDSTKVSNSGVEFNRQQIENSDQLEQVQAEIRTTLVELQDKNDLYQRRTTDLLTKTVEEFTSTVAQFEGTTLGKLIMFLNDELDRLKLQKKIQAIQMLADKERMKREAFEAGIRQKENKVRDVNERMHAKAGDVHVDAASLFLQSVLEEEFEFTVEALASENIIELAQEIDRDNLESLRLNGKAKRMHDRDMIRNYVRNQMFDVVEKRLTKNKIEKLREAKMNLIGEQLNASVRNALKKECQTPSCVSNVGVIVDDLITDAVSYDFDILSPNPSDDKFDQEPEISEIIDKLIKLTVREPHDEVDFLDSTDYQMHLTARNEANAVIRKLIRLAVPDERWKTEGDRIIEHTLSEVFNDAVNEVECRKLAREVRCDDMLHEAISSIYRRVENERIVSFKYSEKTPSPDTSIDLKSIVSTIDIFDPQLSLSLGSDKTSSEYSTESELNQAAGRIIYVDPEDLKKFQPVEIGRRHERFNIEGDIAKRYQDENKCVGKCSPKTSDDSSRGSSGSSNHYTPRCQSYIYFYSAKK